MARTSRSKSTNNANPASPRELIVLTKAEASVAAIPDGLRSLTGVDVDPLQKLLKDAGATLIPLFGATEERARSAMSSYAALPGARDPGSFYRVEVADDAIDALAVAIAETDAVESAYVKPPTSPAVVIDPPDARSEDAPPITPNYTASQGYLDAAPGGVDARWAWSQGGGRGAGVNIIDVEGAWRFTHEDLTANQGGVVGGTQSADIGWRNHGTAVVGVYGGDLNTFGITGIASDARTSAFSIFGAGNSSAAAIRGAAARLNAGDLLLIELHRPGPRNNFASRDDQNGYIAVEWWPDDFAAIQFAYSRGVIVVEATGNGAQNLDDPLYNNPAPGFPASWRNPFNRANADSGAVLVGAGAPPTLNFGPDRSRLDFSNWGASIDAQGWGRDVVTAGYGDLQGGANEDLWYTASFSGTSSASPVVVGTLASVQGILRARGLPLLTPATARQHLRTTGSPQQDAPGRPTSQRIGNRPDIRGIISAIVPKSMVKDAKEQKELTKDKEISKELTKEFKDKDKDVKEYIKDAKEKDLKERKELIKEGVKEIKEKEVEKRFGDKFKDRKDSVEKLSDRIDQRQFERFGPSYAPDLEQRVAAIEHFIDSSLRPEVGASLYAQDLEALKQEAEAQLEAAKSNKDLKDAEL